MVKPTPTNAATLKNRAFVTLTLRTSPEDWRTNPAAFAKYARDHQVESFMEYAEYPDFSAVEIIKALQLKKSLTEAFDQLQ